MLEKWCLRGLFSFPINHSHLLLLLSLYIRKRDWFVNSSSSSSSMGRAPCCDKTTVKKGPWSPEEDAILKTYIDNYGTGGNWIALPTKIAGLKRCGKSCRLRWLNYLRPNLKHGGFTEEEDNIICSLYISIGSRWSIIAAQLPGRTDNDIKNYWNTRLKKKLFGRRKQMNIKPFGIEQDHHELQQMSSSAVERLELHMQLQSPALYPSFWPRLNPLVQQRMMQSIQHQQTLDVVHSEQVNYSDPNNLMLSSSSYSDSSVAVAQLPSNTMMDQDHQRGIMEVGFMPQQQQQQDYPTSQFLKDNMVWWSSDEYNIATATPSEASISWDVATATSFLQSDQGI